MTDPLDMLTPTRPWDMLRLSSSKSVGVTGMTKAEKLDAYTQLTKVFDELAADLEQEMNDLFRKGRCTMTLKVTAELVVDPNDDPRT